MQQFRKSLISVKGPVQGIGTRPFCKKLADQLLLSGHVANRGNQVELLLEGEAFNIDSFLQKFEQFLPATARIETLQSTESDTTDIGYGFTVLHPAEGPFKTGINQCLMPDRVPCSECLTEFYDPQNRRFAYPFISCTQCGPRYSVSGFGPYERSNTSLGAFPMCANCEAEYSSGENRRYLAQTICCPDCGPRYHLGNGETATFEAIVNEITGCLSHGGIVALKSLSGFHLLADPEDSEALSRLRALKQRPAKPFALMFPSLNAAEKHSTISEQEREFLTSPAGPLVLVASNAPFLNEVAPGLDRAAVMLPSTPFYHGLLNIWQKPLVVTSANRKGEALIYEEAHLKTAFPDGIDLVVSHNLDIREAVDDSIVQTLAGGCMVLRPGRGLVPIVLTANDAVFNYPKEPVTGLGAWHKNTVAEWDGEQLYLSRYLGDLDSESIWQERSRQLARFSQNGPLVCDTHPEMSGEIVHGQKAQEVPHHIAHALSACWEHSVSEKILVFTWDGLGYGASQEQLLGGESYLINPEVSHWPKHVAQFRPISMPCGELAYKMPSLVALALLNECRHEDAACENAFQTMFDHGLPEISEYQQDLIYKLFQQSELPFPKTTAVGRLFDGVASLLGVCHINSYEAEAAMRMQAITDVDVNEDRGILPVVFKDGTSLEIDWRPAVSALVAASAKESLKTEVLAGYFHHYLVECIVALAERFDVKKVVFTGGCFQNRMLTKAASRQLNLRGVKSAWPELIPVNDSGVSAGQVMAQIIRLREDISCA